MKFRLLVATLVSAPALNATAAGPVRVDLSVPGMNCATYPVTVRKALQAVPGVKAARVDYATKIAAIEYDPEVASIERLTQVTAHAGYPSTVTGGRQAAKR